MYAAMTKDEDNAADGRFSAACLMVLPGPSFLRNNFENQPFGSAENRYSCFHSHPFLS